MKRQLLIALLTIALGTGTAVAGEGHDHPGGQSHDDGAAGEPETKAFYGSGDEEAEDKDPADSGQDRAGEGGSQRDRDG